MSLSALLLASHSPLGENLTLDTAWVKKNVDKLFAEHYHDTRALYLGVARQSELQHVVGLQVGAGLGRGRRPTTTTLHQSGFGVCYLEVVSPL